MLLCICKPESILSSKLMTQTDLPPEFQEEVLDIPLPPALQHRFARDTWMAITQRGRHFPFSFHLNFLFLVNMMKENWKCHKCTIITAKENMIGCDHCDQWYHW